MTQKHSMGDLPKAVTDLATLPDTEVSDDTPDLIKMPMYEQTRKFRSREATTLYETELQFGPVGFPDVYLAPSERAMTVLEWCSKTGVWSSKNQAEAFIRERLPVAKMTKNLQRRMIKDWSTESDIDCSTAKDAVTRLLLEPVLRLRLQDNQTLAASWLSAPIGSIIRTSQRMMGLEESQTLDAFIEQSNAWSPAEDEPRHYWPAQLWPVEVEDEHHDLQAAFVNFIYRTQVMAREWESLNETQRNGILLAAYGTSSMLSSIAFLTPFTVLHEDIVSRLHIDHLNATGLCDQQGRPSLLLRHTLDVTTLCFGDEESPGEIALQIISPLSQQLELLMMQPDRIAADLRDYRKVYLKAAEPRLRTYLNAIRDSESLPETCGPLLEAAEACMTEWQQLCGLGDDVTGDAHSAVTDYWQRLFAKMVDAVPYDVPFDEVLNEHLAKTTGESLEELQKRATEAVNKLDTESLTHIVSKITAQKAAVNEVVEGYLEFVMITDEMRNAAPKESAARVAVPLDEGAQTDDRIAELEAELAQQSELTELMEEVEAQLNDTIETLRADLHREQQRSESLSHQLAGKQLSTVASGTGLSEAIVRAMGESATLKDALDAMVDLRPDIVEVLPSAYEGIAASGYKNVRKLVDNLIRLCGPYYDAIAVEGLPDTKARAALGAKYKANESKTTLSVPKLRVQREFPYQGKPVLFEQHITLGVKRGDQSCIQIYFKIIQGKLVIAYVGSHLDISSS